MYFLLTVIAAAVCISVTECKERTASLVVLPPLIIGYDELYNDSQPKDDKKHTHHQQEKEKVQQQETMRKGERDSIAVGGRKRESVARDQVIDNKGRRNYRKLLRGRKRLSH